MKGTMVFVHMIGKRVTQQEGESALLTLVTFARFVNHEMREIFHSGAPRGALGSGTHAETLEAEGTKGPIDVVVPLDEMINHHVVDTGAEGADRAHVRHLVTHVVTAHVLHDLHVTVVVALTDLASGREEDG